MGAEGAHRVELRPPVGRRPARVVPGHGGDEVLVRDEAVAVHVELGEVGAGQHFRIGGMVKTGTVLGASDSLKVNFVTTDFVSDVPIQYEGILPDLFREGQGIVAEGEMDVAGVFQASRVLAKHDENFMSPEVKAALDAAGASTDNYMPGGAN